MEDMNIILKYKWEMFMFWDRIRDLTDHLLLARSEAEQSGEDEALEKLSDTYLMQTVSDIFFG